jgi:hypothetical protein
MVEFAKNLADFAAASGKKHVVVLSSLDFGRLRNIDMSRYRSIIMLLVSFRLFFEGMDSPLVGISCLVVLLESQNCTPKYLEAPVCIF